MLKNFLACFAVVMLTACATPASREAMSLTASEVSTKPSEKLKGQVYVRNVTGGQNTNPLWKSLVDSESFKAALEQSLSEIGYGSANPSAKYKVDADLQDLQQPFVGASMTVHSTVGYVVASDEGVKNIPISASGTAGAFEAFVGAHRIRIANERAMKENIREFIKRLTRLFGT